MERPTAPQKRGLQWLFATRTGNRWLLLVPPLLAAAAVLFLHFGLPLLADCLFFQVTGLHCPGCGGVRATLSLLRGDLLAALWYNPMVVLLYALLAAGYLLFAWNALFRRDYRPPFGWLSPKFGFAVLGVVLAYWVIRNLPFYNSFLF